MMKLRSWAIRPCFQQGLAIRMLARTSAHSANSLPPVYSNTMRQENYTERLSKSHESCICFTSTEKVWGHRLSRRFQRNISTSQKVCSTVTSGNPEKCTRPDFNFSSWNPTDPEGPDTDTDHVLSCPSCFHKISPEHQSTEWINKALISATTRNNPDLVRHLLKIGADPAYTGKHDRTALHDAFTFGDRAPEVTIVQMLCDAGAPLNSSSRDISSPLSLACAELDDIFEDSEIDRSELDGPAEVDEAKVNRLLEHIYIMLRAGADPNSGIGMLATPLHLFLRCKAPQSSNTEVYQYCLTTLISKTNARDLNLRDSRSGSTPLHHAAQTTGLGVKLLLEKGADATIPDREGNLPIHRARLPETLHLLIDHSPSSLYTPGDVDLDVLSAQILAGRYHLVKEILKRDPSTAHATSFNDNTALQTTFELAAFEIESDEVALLETRKALLEAGCDPNAKNRDGNTALHLAVTHKKTQLDFAPYGPRGDYLISCAQLQAHLQSLRELKHYGANPSETNNEGQTPLGIVLKDLLRFCQDRDLMYDGTPKYLGVWQMMQRGQQLVVAGVYLESIKGIGGQLTRKEKEGIRKEIERSGKGREWDFVVDLARPVVEQYEVVEGGW